MREGLAADFRRIFIVYLKGFSMGVADVVPGVSGGTIALVVGIYDRLIRAITDIDPREFTPLFRLYDADARAEAKSNITHADIPFLITLGLGILTAVVVLARVMHTATTEYPVPTYGFFFGLIAASAFVLYDQVQLATPRRVAVAVAGVVIAASVTGVTAGATPHGPLIVFVSGAIAICAMILPGVSGAFFLLVLGQYEYMTGVLTDFIDGLLASLDGESLSAVVEPGTVVGIFGVGAVIGLFSMAHVIRFALEHYRATTLTFLVSLMVGSLRLPLERIGANLEGGNLALGVIGAGSGVLLVLLLDRYTDDLQYSS